MKNYFQLKHIILVTTLFVISIYSTYSQQNITNNTTNKSKHILILDSEFTGPVIGPNHKDVISSENKSGFETGQVVKINETYHMFVNEMFNRPHRDLRISYWTSSDATTWKRQSTLVHSISGRSHTNPRSEVWVTGVEFNEEENAWNIFYVAYRAGNKDKGEIEGSDYEGKIWRAKSVMTGINGVAGPYADMEIIMKPDENSQTWEGQQAIASFNPYKAGNKWYSLYDGHTYIPLGPWPTGIVMANNLNGPWTRMPETINPLKIVDVFMENPVATKLKDGRFLIVFDSMGNQEIGYSISEDGLNWSKETRVKTQSNSKKWGDNGDHAMRTPLCAIEEENGKFTIIYTSKLTTTNGKPFYAIGKCTLKWE